MQESAKIKLHKKSIKITGHIFQSISGLNLMKLLFECYKVLPTWIAAQKEQNSFGYVVFGLGRTEA